AVPPSAIDKNSNLVLALRVGNAPYKEKNLGGPYRPLLLGRLEDLMRRQTNSGIPELVLAVVFWLTGSYHLQLFRRRRELREYLWFGIICVANAGTYIFLRSQWKYAVTENFLFLKELEYFLLYT